MTYAIALLITLIIAAVLALVVAIVLHDVESLQSRHNCEDCFYYRNCYCTHWEEGRKPDQWTCEALKLK